MPKTNCSSGCPAPGTHASYGECMRSKSTKVAYCDSANNRDATTQKKWDSELDAYRAAKAEGIQPATTKRKDIDAALAVSDKTNTAFQAV